MKRTITSELAMRVIIPIFMMFLMANGSRAEEASPPEHLSLNLPTDPAGPACAPPAGGAAATKPQPLRQTFFDDFKNFTPSSPRYQFSYEGDSRKPDTRTHYNTPVEKQIYVDPAYMGSGMKALGLNPFTFKDGALHIVADHTPPALQDQLYGRPFTSGILTTHNSFKQAYGYFEIKARFSRAKGAWPAFWLLQPNRWPPEIDVFEGMDDSRANQVLVTSHWQDPGTKNHKQSYCWATVADPDKQFHLYGVLWTPERIVHYIDRQPINELTTPPGLDKPMYLLANLAVTKAAGTTFPVPVTFDIAWIVAYALQ